MQDIRKPYSRSKSNREIGKRVEEFENHHYEDSEAYEEAEPVHIPVKKSFRERRNIDQMDMFPARGRRAYDKGEAHFGRRAADDIVYHDPRTRYERKRQSMGTLAFIAAVLLVVIGGSLLTFMFNRATITIVPKHEDLTDFRKTITFAVPELDTDTTVSFVVATTSLSKQKTLALSETKKVEAKSSGKIIIYNTYSTEPQRLIKNTRFESPEGKIYRINQSVVVPGKTADKPGSVEVVIYADSFGAEYNSAPTDFTIPGFKGTPQYTGFYARSNGPITGGASGSASLASISDINAAKDELALELARDLKNILTKEKRGGYVGLYSAIDVVYEDNEEALLRGETSTYQVTATGYLMFAEGSELARSVAQSAVREYKDEPVRLDHTDKIVFTKKDADRVPEKQTLDILTEGSPRVVFLTDANSLKALMAGKKRTEFVELMKGIPSVESAEISFSPLWLSTFPIETSKINVVESLPRR